MILFSKMGMIGGEAVGGKIMSLILDILNQGVYKTSMRRSYLGSWIQSLEKKSGPEK